MVSSAYNLREFVEIIESWGFTDVMLPFLIIFTILFAVLQKVKILGDDKKNMNVVLALAIALTVVIPHVLGVYPSDEMDPITIMNRALPAVSIVVIAIIMMLILIGIFGGEAKMFGATLPVWVTGISLLIVLWIFGSAAGWFGWGSGWGWFNDFFGSDAVAIIIIILVFGIIIAFVTGGGEREERTRFKRLGDDWGRIFGGGK